MKTARGVHLGDLALDIDARVAAARKECEQLSLKWRLVEGTEHE
jgi:hypothetical protein